MNPANATYFQALPPASNASATSPACNVIDCAGYDFLELIVNLGAVYAAATVLKLQESDAKSSGTALTSGTDVPGTIFGTSYTLGAPSNTPCAPGGTASASTGVYPETDQYPLSALPANANTIYIVNVDLKARKRYLLPVMTVGAGGATIVGMVARLSRAEVAPHLPSQVVPTNGGLLQSPPFYPNASGT
jgi:hypothetical protein